MVHLIPQPQQVQFVVNRVTEWGNVTQDQRTQSHAINDLAGKKINDAELPEETTQKK